MLLCAVVALFLQVWSKVRRAGIPPTPRCGFSTTVHKQRNLVVFGGVFDQVRILQNLLAAELRIK